MKKHLALALLIAGSVVNTSLVMADNEVPATGSKSVIVSKFNDVTDYLAAKKDAVVALAQEHPYITSTAAVSTVLVAAYKFSATFRRLIGMETQEDMQKRYSASFEV
jgi:hypothetical protein